jgi:putative ATP-dependent endonuclease of OLD family
MIERLIIKNFRSFKELEIKLGQINAFIGPNNAGKSNIMAALKLVLGRTRPSVHLFNDKDFHNYDKSRDIEIEVRFDRYLATSPQVGGYPLQVWGFRLEYDGDNCDYVATNRDGEVLTWPSGKEVHISNEMKDEVLLMYLGLSRQAYQQIKPTQWTIYGKLLRHIEKAIDSSKKKKFKSDIESTYEANVALDLKPVIDSTKEFVKKQTGLDLDFKLSIVDPMETLKNLRPYFRELGATIEFDAEDVGSGTQSALAIAIARTYAQLVRQPIALAIEEPELYLHPHACRHFYQLLLEIAEEGVQIFYTTHERSFVDLMHHQNIHLVRMVSRETCVTSGNSLSLSLSEATKIASKFDSTLNEIFFANRVILTEGPADKIATQHALEKQGINLDKENISVAECGGRGSIKDIATILKHFEIPCHVLIDEDPGNSETQRTIEDLRSLIGNENVFLASPGLERLFSLPSKPSKKDALEIFPQWFQNNAIPAVYVDLKRRMGFENE